MSTAPEPSDAQKEKAQLFFQYGNDAAMKSNFDYAIQMYREACKFDPQNLVYRQALRGIERRKFNNEPAKVGRLVGARVQPIRLKIKTVKAKKDWKSVMEACEDAFVHNPWDVSCARDAAEAAENLEYLLLAQWYLESVQAQANDAEFFRHMAHVHEVNTSWAKAIQAWERVKKLDPSDENAFRQINQLSANATIQRGKFDDAIDKSDERKVADAAAEIEDMKAAKLSPEERLAKEIKENPTRPGAYLELADKYKERGQLDEAEKLLGQALRAMPKDTTIQLTYAEVQISRLNRAIDKWTRAVKENPTEPAARAKLQQLKKMLQDYEIKEFRRRLTVYPEDAQLQYKLGCLLAEAAQHDEAIKLFQQARNNASLKVSALYEAGRSFEALNSMKLAERSFQEALKAADSSDTPTLLKLNYRLGRVNEALGNTAVAAEHYSEVAAVDYSYEDVAKRLRDLEA